MLWIHLTVWVCQKKMGKKPKTYQLLNFDTTDYTCSLIRKEEKIPHSLCRLRDSVGLGGPRWHGNSWQRGIAENGSSRLSTLMIDIPGDLICYVCSKPAIWKGAHWCGCCPCPCTLIKNLIMILRYDTDIKYLCPPTMRGVGGDILFLVL